MANIQYGPNFTVDDIKRQLLSYNRDYDNRQTWRYAADDVNLAAQAAQQQQTVDYAEATNKAYAQFLSQQHAIEGSAAVGRGKQNLSLANMAELNEAYDNYLTTYRENQLSIETQRQKGVSDIDKELTTQATNVKKYADAHFDYLQWLWDTYEAGEHDLFGRDATVGSPAVKSSAIWNKYTVVDKDGSRRLKTKAELMKPVWDDEHQEWVSLFDDDGNLTIAGVDFFDQMQNERLTDHTFGEYLSEADADLYAWSRSYNPYNYTEDEWGQSTQKGSFKTMVGMTAADSTYSFAERFGGLSSGQIKDTFEKYQKTFENIATMDPERDADRILSNIKTRTGQLFDMLEDLGIDGELKEAGLDRDRVAGILQQAVERVKSGKEIDEEFWGSVASGALIGALAGGGVAGATGKAVAGIGAAAAAGGFTGALALGPVGIGIAVLGTLVGITTGAIVGAKTAEGSKEAQLGINRRTVEQMEAEYRNMINTVVNYSLQKRRQAEIDVYGKSTSEYNPNYKFIGPSAAPNADVDAPVSSAVYPGQSSRGRTYPDTDVAKWNWGQSHHVKLDVDGKTEYLNVLAAFSGISMSSDLLSQSKVGQVFIKNGVTYVKGADNYLVKLQGSKNTQKLYDYYKGTKYDLG